MYICQQVGISLLDFLNPYSDLPKLGNSILDSHRSLGEAEGFQVILIKFSHP